MRQSLKLQRGYDSMGARFRKSIKLPGGFRINASKSGIGYSYGTKGFRVTKTANGTTRTTASIFGTGISYVEESKNSNPPTEPQHKPRGCGCLFYAILVPVIIILVWTLWFLVFRTDDTPDPTANVEPTQPNASIVSEPPEKQDIEEYLTGLGYEIVQTRQNKFLLEFMLTLPGDVSGDMDDWPEIHAAFLDAAAEAQNLGGQSNIVVLYLRDSNGKNCLSVSGGKETYNTFDVEPSASADTHEDNTIVWISDTGKRYHSNPDCSGLKDPSPVRRSYAVSHGYTACSRCY